jgi:hypothetical protein
MKTKLIYFSDQQISRVQKDANEREISFTEMVRRIIDQHYEFKISYSVCNDSTFNSYFTYQNPVIPEMTRTTGFDATLICPTPIWTFNCADAL